MMRRLDALFGGAIHASTISDDFRERLEHWREHCGLPRELYERMHRLRIWRNASEHGDAARWRREGPRDEAELEEMLQAVDRLAEKISAARMSDG